MVVMDTIMNTKTIMVVPQLAPIPLGARAVNVNRYLEIQYV
jgi:hypothetical protein